MVQKYKGDASTMQSAHWIFGISWLKLSFCTHGLPYRQALQPRHPYTSFFIKETVSTECPALSAPLAKLSASLAVLPFALPPPGTIKICFILYPPHYAAWFPVPSLLIFSGKQAVILLYTMFPKEDTILPPPDCV